MEKLYEIVPNINLNDFFKKIEIIEQANKTKKSPPLPTSKLVIFEAIKTYFYKKHLKYTTLANKKNSKAQDEQARYEQHRAHFTTLCILFAETKKIIDPKVFHERLKETIDKTKIDHAFSSDKRYITLVNLLVTLPIPYLLSSYNEFSQKLLLANKETLTPSSQHLQEMVTTAYAAKKGNEILSGQDSAFDDDLEIEQHNKTKKLLKQTDITLADNVCTINDSLIEKITSPGAQNSHTLFCDGNTGMIGLLVIENQCLKITVKDPCVFLSLDVSNLPKSLKEITIININDSGTVLVKNSLNADSILICSKHYFDEKSVKISAGKFRIISE